MNSKENQNKENQNKQNQSNSTTMDLEKLQQKYSNLIAQYKAAVYEYTNFLSQQAIGPCSKYYGGDKNIDKACYQDVWSKSGCTTDAFNKQSSSWIKGQTLNDIVYKAFLWATSTDPTHREQCYGNSKNYSKATKPEYKINKSSFSAINGYAVVGNRIGINQSATLQQCEASCAKLSNCTGATFITPKGNNRGCILTGGDSKIVKDREGTYAIIPKSKQLLLNMENINQQLIATNKEIRNKIKNVEPVITENINKSSNKTQELINTYKDLTEEREEILNLLRQYETLDNVENENQIIINKNYYSYVLLSILAIAVIFLLYRVSFPPVSSYTQITPFTPNVQYSGILGMNAYFIVFILILLTIGIHYFFKYFP
jgi:hypothetical protein